jgi:hypothetical protein
MPGVAGLPASVPPAERQWTEGLLVAAAASMDSRMLAKIAARLRASLDQDESPPSDAEPADRVNELWFIIRSDGRMLFRRELVSEASVLFQAVANRWSDRGRARR